VTTKNDAANIWLDKAMSDIKAARVLFGADMYLHVGFMCHQAIEKSFKACYISLRDERHPHTHNLESLADECGLSEKIDDSKAATLQKLMPLYTATRYEDEGNAIANLLTKSYCKTLIKETGVLMNWIMQFIN